MQYCTLGRTGLKVSRLGFGAMRLPMTGPEDDRRINRELAIPMIHKAFESGINYIDTAVGYCNQDNQRVVGEALKGWRDRIIVSTKNHYYGDDESAWRRHLEDSLERLQIDHIDIYNHHGVNWDKYTEHIAPHMAAWMQKAKDEGLIKHICFSFHDHNDALLKLIDEDYADVITLQYNLLDRSLEEGIAKAGANNIGVVVMGPVGGGRLGVPSDVLESTVEGIEQVPELAMRFVLANPDVSIALSGMSTMQQVEENIKTCSDTRTLSDAEKAAIEPHMQRLQKMADLYCTGCGYCMPCEQGVNIPAVFSQANLARVYGLKEAAEQRYQGLIKRGKSADCYTQCGACVPKCPQNIAVPDELEKAHKLLAGA